MVAKLVILKKRAWNGSEKALLEIDAKDAKGCDAKPAEMMK